MKYCLVIAQIIFLWSGISSQSISGETYICPGDIEYYTIVDERCVSYTSSEWDITNGTYDFVGFVEMAEVQWPHETDENSGTVSVSYTCLTEEGSTIVEEDLSLDVDIRQIQVPFFGDSYVERPIEDNSSFILYTPDQGDNFLYSWSFPECFTGSDGSNYTTVTPDLYGIGTICLTVYDNTCGTSITECIDVTRSCEDFITYTASDVIPPFTSAGINISTTGDVVPTLDYTEFKAGESIDLNPGFFVGPEFFAHIGECGRSPESEGCIGMGTSGLSQSFDIDNEIETPYSENDEMNGGGNTELLVSDEIKMTIAPNPASEDFTVTIKDYDMNQKYTFEILSLNGSAVYNGQILGPKTQIGISNFRKGMYLVKIYTANNISVGRLVKY